MGNKAKKRSGELNNELREGGVPSETMEKSKNTNKDENEMTSDIENSINEANDSGAINAAKLLCSQDSSNILNDLNEYINISKNGYSFDNDSYHSYYIDQYRDKYIDHMQMDSSYGNQPPRRFFPLFFSEWIYFRSTYGYNLLKDLYKERKKYLINKNVNKIGNIDIIFDSIQKSIETNKQFNKQEIILNNEINKYNSIIKNTNSNIDGIDTNLNIEKTKNNKKNEMFLKQVSNYTYYTYLLYLTAFVIYLISIDFTSIIFSIKNLSFIIFLYLLPGYIYPFIYNKLLLPVIFFIYNNNFFTKPYPIVAFDDISDQKFYNENI